MFLHALRGKIVQRPDDFLYTEWFRTNSESRLQIPKWFTKSSKKQSTSLARKNGNNLLTYYVRAVIKTLNSGFQRWYCDDDTVQMDQLPRKSVWKQKTLGLKLQKKNNNSSLRPMDAFTVYILWSFMLSEVKQFIEQTTSCIQSDSEQIPNLD